ncbi:MAG TPA: YidC/Oxa1 family membrane protein insertase, partial [Streptosporangiaceae bacterium]|nr:YidC/Oxa1 family membrane protein insertase [Streptosporangiaceae bacterium]
QQREGTSLFAGVLPLLAQWPFFSVLYRLFLTPVISGHPNALLSDQLLGVPLGSRWLAGAGPFSAHGAVFLGLFALLALVSWAAVRLARRFTAAAGAPGAAGAAARPGGAVGGLTRVLPYLTIVIAAFVPLAAGLYLLTTTAWTAAERTVLMRRIQARQQPRLAAA